MRELTVRLLKRDFSYGFSANICIYDGLTFFFSSCFIRTIFFCYLKLVNKSKYSHLTRNRTDEFKNYFRRQIGKSFKFNNFIVR